MDWSFLGLQNFFESEAFSHIIFFVGGTVVIPIAFGLHAVLDWLLPKRQKYEKFGIKIVQSDKSIGLHKEGWQRLGIPENVKRVRVTSSNPDNAGKSKSQTILRDRLNRRKENDDKVAMSQKTFETLFPSLDYDKEDLYPLSVEVKNDNFVSQYFSPSDEITKNQNRVGATITVIILIIDLILFGAEVRFF